MQTTQKTSSWFVFFYTSKFLGILTSNGRSQYLRSAIPGGNFGEVQRLFILMPTYINRLLQVFEPKHKVPKN
ncbi:hypothetical protein FFWV33_03630 [Flavobacterium faecale]|uniref:Uncharacterized protein n=1 Tax=Flavobacterium faecale TaxID=1355330 RepID=A0A2S1LAC8_9FLAO|nr:hypothetical protein FFWV33_03630 [Flavobacterium faecale]